jgi:hypothetical protein
MACIASGGASDDYLSWSAKQAKRVGKRMRANGQVIGEQGVLGLLGKNTDRSIRYKLRATWLTPDVIRASARLRQLHEGLSADQTRALVAEAEAIQGTAVLIEIDPVEGSGVIPSDWSALLKPANETDSERSVVGVKYDTLSRIKALSGVTQRDFAYEAFWVVFPLSRPTGDPLFASSNREAELVVRIRGKRGTVRWKIPDVIRSPISSRHGR